MNLGAFWELAHPTAYFALAALEAASPADFAASATRTVVPPTSESAGLRMTRSVAPMPSRISRVGPKSRPNVTLRS